MPRSGQKIVPRSVAEASQRLESIEREIELILRAFPELRRSHSQPNSSVMPWLKRDRLSRGIWRTDTLRLH